MSVALVGSSVVLALGAGRHHGARIVLPVIVLIVIVVGVVLVIQRHRDRRPLKDESAAPPTTERHSAPMVSAPRDPTPAARSVSRGDNVLATAATGRALPSGRYGISGLLRSEWTKLRTVRSTMWTLGITIVLGIGVSAIATAETRAHWSTMSRHDRLSFDPTSTSLIGVFIGQFAIGILGVLVMSAEYGTGTIRATFSASPRRPMVLVAKTIVFGIVAVVVAEIVSFLAFFLGQALLSSPAVHSTLSSPGALRAVVGSGLYICVLGLFSLGLATIIRHTAGAISAFVGILLVLPLIVQALPSSLQFDIRPYLPDRIGSVMISHSGFDGSFAPWIGLLILCGYAAAALVAGAVLLVRRDA